MQKQTLSAGKGVLSMQFTALVIKKFCLELLSTGEISLINGNSFHSEKRHESVDRSPSWLTDFFLIKDNIQEQD